MEINWVVSEASRSNFASHIIPIAFTSSVTLMERKERQLVPNGFRPKETIL